MYLTYDSQADAAYIGFRELSEGELVASTEDCKIGEIETQVFADFDESGLIIGIEFLHASRVLPPSALKGAKQLS